MSEWPSGVIVDPHTMEQVGEEEDSMIFSIMNTCVRSSTMSTKTKRMATSLAMVSAISTGGSSGY